MTQPDFRARCAELVELLEDEWSGVSHQPEALNRARAALATPLPEPPTVMEALAARPLLEQVARLGDCIGANTVGKIMAISSRAAAWLEANPPGQPVEIEPRGCPTPGACSCVEPATPPPEAPVDGEVAELAALIRQCALAWEPDARLLGNMTAAQLARAAELLERTATPPPKKNTKPGFINVCVEGHPPAPYENWEDWLVDTFKNRTIKGVCIRALISGDFSFDKKEAATPPPEPPTDEELLDLFQWHGALSFARAALERWGHG